jgi:predicted lipoprotein
MKRLGIAFALLALVTAPGARADDAASVRAVYRDWMVPRSVELVAASARLSSALQAYCTTAPADAEAALTVARGAWNTALVAWERVSAVAIGTVVDYRMPGRLDFTPTRPRMIEKAIAAAPNSAADMDRIGTPAKGFPALEWLMWTKPMPPASPACHYAVQVGREIEREAQFMEKGFREAAATPLDPAAAKTALSDFVNQWVGGLDRLRWADMEKPVQKAATSGKKAAPEFLRGASGADAASWAARWDALRALAVADGSGSLASLLRERDQAKLAEALARSVEQAGAAMKGLDTADPEKVMASARRLSGLRRIVEGQVAPALDVRIGFSDSDGD